jgi:hypothetical protein
MHSRRIGLRLVRFYRYANDVDQGVRTQTLSVPENPNASTSSRMPSRTSSITGSTNVEKILDRGSG